MISNETANTFAKSWTNYFPFQRVMETFGERGTSAKVQAYNPVKGFKGSTRDIIDPIESIVKNVYLF